MKVGSYKLEKLTAAFVWHNDWRQHNGRQDRLECLRRASHAEGLAGDNNYVFLCSVHAGSGYEWLWKRFDQKMIMDDLFGVLLIIIVGLIKREPLRL